LEWWTGEIDTLKQLLQANRIPYLKIMPMSSGKVYVIGKFGQYSVDQLLQLHLNIKGINKVREASACSN